ncbi:glycosyl transferase family 1 [Candidatus Uhrbacteria bacterium CG_4_9_14_0_2_um_filter_41_50]|uniref:Glycosyl transferase family 1 n=1 Tax=Candidatus Uhrbacteria bacterium CG_4_9_14_0_2_um_filter_41_50 TaxID=1975031 RepID=A0A2M8ENH6_9BACT|nr:MAG: glycosyl transferase family 1 [Candidatus Uhrbacteria bacterium CG_4_10_14_3_um_filter_41_21]PIZ54984.1 MAG: glycosyl transferase family 1 [Candidatus Uhrbacteria bacterium CG_4_10_14_0_2_um_filter_41_21]PJB84349.1 MAG: glycosyl transferase family 1 [Candidatus Uhrbacteria bacterium CG_4_9_14_0_8_um_filter_41_16]PJC24303.1 MAG: glycosyl transferase family 1 [Candidatus Uhrbacteria bacterium CG_4_9_14_0_2_um_filter_41_50]PJE75334.1 MAG: glycosyl transferase family 1 [Candidatus Uhrbacter
MKIAMIGQKGIAPGERAGGIEKHVAEISERLVGFGHDVTVYARAKYMPEMPRTYKGIDLIFLPTIYSKNLEAILHTFVSTIHCLFQKYDIIHYHGVGPATLAWLPKLFSRESTVVVTFHSQDRFHAKWGLFARLYLHFGEWASAVFADYCISVSHTMQVFIRDHYRREAIYIPNGAEIKDEQGVNLIEKFGLSKKGYLINVGRIVPQKGLQFLIEAFQKLETDKHLVIVGAPSFSDDYYALLRELANENDKIHFLGFQNGKTLDQLYANAYLYVHPSEAEGLPLVILEAMSFGLAPLVSDIEPNIEAIHGVGFTFPSGNVEELRQKLEYLVNNPAAVKNEGEEALATVDIHFNWDKITEHIEAVYITARH